VTVVRVGHKHISDGLWHNMTILYYHIIHVQHTHVDNELIFVAYYSV
jgi:hypothetical protein